MTIVIDGLDLVNSKRRLPKEAFFVDTNVVIGFKDPFSHSSDAPSLQKRQEDISATIGYLKSFGIKAYATLGIVLEYYKNLQVGFYRVQPGKNDFDLADFKKMRKNDSNFKLGWELQMKSLRKVFRRNFPLFEGYPSAEETVSTFTGLEVDFGDQLLFKTVMTAPSNMWCIFSNDGDFYSFPDDLYLLTTNERVIRTAKKDNKLF